ncbi:MAG: carbon-nitrogen hydrolase family protein [Candidatus Pacearchaeota archaeon]|nr:carbon-nitrogen hydrolase family protein [Candidatus Pacearchaeota archaeon]
MRIGMKKDPIVALAQIKYFDTSEKNNVKKIKKYIRLAKKRKADIVCFPESCIHKKDFLSFDHELVKEIREECRKNSIWCIIDDDMIIRRGVFNTAILIDREGKIKGEYRKIHLYGEGDGVRAGRRVRVFKTDFAKVGIAICWDLKDEKIFRKMKKKGAEIIFCPASWRYELYAHHAKKYKKKYKERERTTLKSLIMTRAFENLFFVALCTPMGGKEDKDMISHSMISSPHKVLSEIKNREGLITAKINLEEISRLQKLYDEKRIK